MVTRSGFRWRDNPQFCQARQDNLRCKIQKPTSEVSRRQAVVLFFVRSQAGVLPVLDTAEMPMVGNMRICASNREFYAATIR